MVSRFVPEPGQIRRFSICSNHLSPNGSINVPQIRLCRFRRNLIFGASARLGFGNDFAGFEERRGWFAGSVRRVCRHFFQVIF
jgi:hypothetical protein